MIRIEGLRHRILDIGSFESGSRVIALIGPNGAGKTELLELLAGMERPQEGGITINDSDPRDSMVGWIGEFPDQTMLFSRVHDEVSSSLRFMKMGAEEADAKVIDLMGRLGCSHLEGRSIKDLSGGEKALVAFAAAIISEPDIMLMDEADSHMDEGSASRLWDGLSDFSGHILFSTHDMDRASLADEVIFLLDGRIVHSGRPKEVFGLLRGTCYHPSTWRLSL